MTFKEVIKAKWTKLTMNVSGTNGRGGVTDNQMWGGKDQRSKWSKRIILSISQSLLATLFVSGKSKASKDNANTGLTSIGIWDLVQIRGRRNVIYVRCDPLTKYSREQLTPWELRIIQRAFPCGCHRHNDVRLNFVSGEINCELNTHLFIHKFTAKTCLVIMLSIYFFIFELHVFRLFSGPELFSEVSI